MAIRSDVTFAPIPETQLTFCNVPLVPVRNRAGETRYLCATWGGAMFVFDRHGNEKVMPYPEGSLGSYSFTPAVEDGFAWAVHTGGKITLIDVDAGEYVLVQDVPLKIINWGADITADGLLVCEASPGDVMVYDTKRRQVAHMLAQISEEGHYAHHIRAAADGRVVVQITTPGAELVLVDPKAGTFESFKPEAMREVKTQASVPGFLPDGRFAIPGRRALLTITYPDMRDSDPIPYPDPEKDGWTVVRDWGDGRMFAHRGDGGPLYALNADTKWAVYLDEFPTEVGVANPIKFSALPDGGMLGISQFGELVEYQRDRPARIVAELSNYGKQRICYLQPGDGDLVFTTTFINMSCQELNYRTGRGRNIRPCQAKGGQPAGAAWHGGKLWIAAYGGAEIDVYDPEKDGQWPENPRHVLDLGEGQMRPRGLYSDGRYLWTITHARYGTLGGALAKVDPEAETCKVWRNLVRDQNPTALEVDPPRRRVYVSTTIHADSQSAPPAQGDAAVFAFDTDAEQIDWVVNPVEGAHTLTIQAAPVDGLLPVLAHLEDEAVWLLLDVVTGEERRRFQLDVPEEWESYELFVGGDGRLYIASSHGVFGYDFDTGVGEQLLEGSASKPMVRGNDLFFLRGYEVGVVEGFFGG